MADKFDMEKSVYITIMGLVFVSVVSIVFHKYWLQYVGKAMGPIAQLFLYGLAVALGAIIVTRGVGGISWKELVVPLVMVLVFSYGIYFYINPAHLPQLFDSQSIMSARLWTSQNIMGGLLG